MTCNPESRHRSISSLDIQLLQFHQFDSSAQLESGVKQSSSSSASRNLEGAWYKGRSEGQKVIIIVNAMDLSCIANFRRLIEGGLNRCEDISFPFESERDRERD